jgi:hypothetical protein
MKVEKCLFVAEFLYYFGQDHFWEMEQSGLDTCAWKEISEVAIGVYYSAMLKTSTMFKSG